MTNDFETLVEMLTRAGFQFTVDFSEKVQVISLEVGANKVHGYAGFVTSFTFENGNLDHVQIDD